jgi:hypothetical protein
MVGKRERLIHTGDPKMKPTTEANLTNLGHPLLAYHAHLVPNAQSQHIPKHHTRAVQKSKHLTRINTKYWEK